MMPMTALPHKESGQQCYIMVGDQIKYEPAWQKRCKRQMLSKLAVNDCLTSMTAGMKNRAIKQTVDVVEGLK